MRSNLTEERDQGTSERAVVHLDLDGASAIYRVHGWPYTGDGDSLFETGLQHALEFFDRANVRATLFVIAEDLDKSRKRELLKEAVSRGHEIASHSYSHRQLTTLDLREKRREIFASRDRLQTELGIEVRGFRAPAFDIDRDSLELISEAGYTYDSSVFPNARFARKLGVFRISDSPHRPLNDHTLVELPLPSYSPFPFPFHPCYSLVLGTWYFRAGLRRFRKTGAPLVLLFHLADLTDPFQYQHLHHWKAKFYSLPHVSSSRKRELCDQMLDSIRQQYEFVDTSRLLLQYT